MLYIALALSAMLPAAWVLYRRRDAAFVASIFVAAAFVHTADWVASGALGLYKYHPGLAADKVLDDAFGIALAELGFVSSMAVLLQAFVPEWWGAVIGSAVVTGLEVWFTRVGALETLGWRHWYTTGGFVIYFSLVRLYRLWAQRHGATSKWPHLVVRVALALTFNGMFEIVLWATKAAQSSITLIANPENNQALMRLLWHLSLFAPLCYWVLAGPHFTRRQRLVAALAMSVAVKQGLVTTGLRTFRPPWNPVLHGLLQVVFFAAACMADDWIRAWA